MCKQATASTYTMCKQDTASTYTMCKQALSNLKKKMGLQCNANGRDDDRGASEYKYATCLALPSHLAHVKFTQLLQHIM